MAVYKCGYNFFTQWMKFVVASLSNSVVIVIDWLSPVRVMGMCKCDDLLLIVYMFHIQSTSNLMQQLQCQVWIETRILSLVIIFPYFHSSSSFCLSLLLLVAKILASHSFGSSFMPCVLVCCMWSNRMCLLLCFAIDRKIVVYSVVVGIPYCSLWKFLGCGKFL